MYKRALKEITKIMGVDETDSQQLDAVGSELFGEKWMGCYSSDEIYPREEGFYIANLDKRSEPGSHWVAIVRRGKILYFFDSFARQQRHTLKLKDPNFVIVSEANPTIVQHARENNCGQRALAFLLVWDVDPEEALSI